MIKNIPEIHGESRGYLSFVVSNPYVMPWCSKWFPGDVEPTIAGQELVGVFTITEEIDQALELVRVLGANVGSLA